MVGWNVLAVGWVGIFILQFGWFANLFWLSGLVCGFVKFFRTGRIIAFVGLVLSIVSIVMLYSQEIPANEGNVGPPLKLIGLGIGCWFWLLSQLLVICGTFCSARTADNPQTEKSDTVC
jgi:membrane-bound ClpP family serine protease